VRGLVDATELSRPRPKRRRWPWIVGAVAGLLALCLAVPIAAIVVPVIRNTWTLSATSSASTARRCSNNAPTTSTRSRPPTAPTQTKPVSLAIGYDESHQTQVDINGDRATVTEYWEVHLTFVQDHPGGAIGAATEPQPWTATAQRERDGWRLTSLTTPPWCSTRHDDGTTTGYVKC
jgi:hypothetical protein